VCVVLEARYLCVLIIITSMLLVQSFGTTRLGLLTSIPNYLLQSSMRNDQTSSKNEVKGMDEEWGRIGIGFSTAEAVLP
jgi:hypothetical protein